jgi:alpha-tubulin suppressor-like RCC1 family protein
MHRPRLARSLFALCPMLLALGACGPDITTPDATSVPPPALAQLPVTGFPLEQVAAGGEHSCGLAKGGRAYCWGDGFYGQLGDGDFDNDSVPAVVAGGYTFTTMTAAQSSTCGLVRGGQALCWGTNFSGQLGDGGVLPQSEVPIPVAGGYGYLALDAGESHVCGIRNDQRTLCWGTTSSTAGSNAPVVVPGGLTFVAISAGGDVACALTRTGQAYCWGKNEYGQFGDGTSFTQSAVPVAVSGGHVFTAISVGNRHSCGRTKSGAIWCWGDGANGQLGNAQYVPSLVPTLVSGGYNWVALSAGGSFTCGIVKAGQLFCWGENSTGQLGNGSNATSNVPVAAGGLAFTSVSAGVQHACGLTKSLGTWCWGNNLSGRLGNGNSVDSYAPSPVSAP